MKYKRYIFPILMGFTMSNVMSLVNTGSIKFPNIIVMMLLQATVASIASIIFPAGIVGDKLTRKYLPKLSEIGFLLVSSILPAIFFTSVMSIPGLLIMKGYSDVFWRIYLNSLPLFILYGYVVSVIMNVIIDKSLSEKRK